MKIPENLLPPYDFLTLQSDSSFHEAALKAFQFQYQHNTVYRFWVNQFRKSHFTPNHWLDIPFLPVEVYKYQTVSCADFVQLAHVPFFETSGTTDGKPGRHYQMFPDWYYRATLHGFPKSWGEIQDYHILALLPSYTERPHASLVKMVQYWMAVNPSKQHHWYLDEWEALYIKLKSLSARGEKTLLIGVTFALLEFVQHFPLHFPDLFIVETGGMKGRGKEWVREALHKKLFDGTGSLHIYSEYGMTELTSQAYLLDDGFFHAPPWMRMAVRDPYDPLEVRLEGKGALCVIDLANIGSCCFLALADVGEVLPDGRFMVNGRLDHSELRGCNLMWSGSSSQVL